MSFELTFLPVPLPVPVSLSHSFPIAITLYLPVYVAGIVVINKSHASLSN